MAKFQFINNEQHSIVSNFIYFFLWTTFFSLFFSSFFNLFYYQYFKKTSYLYFIQTFLSIFIRFFIFIEKLKFLYLFLSQFYIFMSSYSISIVFCLWGRQKFGQIERLIKVRENTQSRIRFQQCKVNSIINICHIIYRSVVEMSNYTLLRSFVLQKQVTQESQIIKGEVRVMNGYADLTNIFRQIGDPQQFRFKIYDFSDNKYHQVRDYCAEFQELEEGYFVPVELLRTEIVLIKFVLDASQTHSINSGSQIASDTSSTKKQRSKQRTIAEVIQIVKQWRQIHTSSSNGKKVNLQESAEMLGISKKSLDDYYYQLRLGEKYDFDFTSHLNDKVGVLRTFIKDVKTNKKDSRSKLDKHPKKLKIIQEQLGQYKTKQSKTKTKGGNSSKKGKSQSSDQNQQDQQIDKRMMKQNQLPQDPIKKQLSSIQNQFYSQFQFMGEEPPDPFLNFQCDFKKKSYDDLSDQLFF